MEYNYFQKEKLEYEDIEVPDELLLLVRRTVAADRRRKALKQRNHIIRAAGSVAAVIFVCLMIGVNSSYAFAKTAVKVPVVKSVAKALIVRSYKTEVITAAEEELEIARQEKAARKNEKKQEPEQKQEPVPEVSGNEIKETEPETAAPEEQEEALQGLEAWISGLTLEELKGVTELYQANMEKDYADTPEKLRTVLLAELPKKEIYLYGYHENGALNGVALRVKDSFQCFDWTYMDGSKKLPEIACADFNGDGKEEIAVLFYRETVYKEQISEDAAAPLENAEEKSAKEETEAANSGAQAENAPEKPADETGLPETTDTADISDAKKPAADNEEKESAIKENMPDVSQNDISPAEDTEKKAEIQPTELRVISTQGESWTISVLFAKDYENQLLGMLKAEYNQETNTLQLYLKEEALGEEIALEGEEEAKRTFKALQIAPQRTFQLENNLSLQFQAEAVFQKEDGEDEIITLPTDYEAGIYYEADTLEVKTIEELQENLE